MKTNMQETSLMAYDEIFPQLGKKQESVFYVIKLNEPITNTEIAEKLMVSINRITPRTNELVKLGLVEGKEKRKCSITGRLAIAWGLRKDKIAWDTKDNQLTFDNIA